MIQRHKIRWYFLCVFLISSLVTSPGAIGKTASIDIISKNLSHRIVALDAIETRLKLIIGFTIAGDLPSGPEGTRANGHLSHDGSILASFAVPKLDYFGGNLVFYLPYNIAAGDYELYIELTDISSGTIISTKNYTVQSIETVPYRETDPRNNWMQPPPIPLLNPPDEALGAIITPSDIARGYVIWHRRPFAYVYPNSAPKQSDVISAISVRMAQNEYEPATFSLYSLQDIHNISISISSLLNDNGTSLPETEIYVVKTVPRVKSRQNPENGYEMRPRLLERNNSCSTEAGQSRRFWLTLQTTAETPPGQYNGTITITTDYGSTEIPLSVEVLPFALVERPDREYGFLMTYEFQEMTAQDLTEEERAKVYENGLKYYLSLREHGLTTVISHSPFTFQRRPDGSPDLRDLEAALKAFNAAGFTGPFIYYCGHLVQSAKPSWAGSTLGFDPVRHPLLMKEIIAYARQNFPETNLVDLYWMPGDEVHDSSGGPDRMQIAESLLNAIWDLDEKTALTVKAPVSWPLDIKFDDQPLYGEPWDYPNEATLPESVDNAEIVRRTFGVYFIKAPYVGFAPWTFQTSENAGGDPYTDLDAVRRPEVMIAYPGTDGPMQTPEYEAVREGIDDGKYAYILKTRIDIAKQSPNSEMQDLAAQAESFYKEMLDKADTVNLDGMEQNLEEMINWILILDPESAVAYDTLSLEKTGTGSGNVTSSPAGIDCGPDCVAIYATNTTITLTAAADIDSTFSGWSGGGCSGTGQCVITINGDALIGASFTLTASPPLAEIIIDNTGPQFSTTGTWYTSGYPNPYGSSSLYASIDRTQTTATATWSPDISQPGIYEVYAWWTAGTGRANDARYTITHAAGSSVVIVDQKRNGGQWNYLGTYEFNAGTGGMVTISNYSEDPNYVPDKISDSVGADAIKFVLISVSPGVIYIGHDGICGGKLPCHSSVQNGIVAAGNGNEIKMAQGVFHEDITIDVPKVIIFQAGWNFEFSFRVDPSFSIVRSAAAAVNTALEGSIIINDGTVIIE